MGGGGGGGEVNFKRFVWNFFSRHTAHQSLA